MEYTSRDLQIVDARKRRVTGDCFDNVNVSNFSISHSVPDCGIAGIESSVEGAEQRFADLSGGFVAFDRVGSVLGNWFLTEYRLFRL